MTSNGDLKQTPPLQTPPPPIDPSPYYRVVGIGFCGSFVVLCLWCFFLLGFCGGLLII